MKLTMSFIAKRFEPQSFAVIFSSLKTEVNKSYKDMTNKMLDLVSKEKVCLGRESERENIGIKLRRY